MKHEQTLAKLFYVHLSAKPASMPVLYASLMPSKFPHSAIGMALCTGMIVETIHGIFLAFSSFSRELTDPMSLPQQSHNHQTEDYGIQNMQFFLCPSLHTYMIKHGFVTPQCLQHTAKLPNRPPHWCSPNCQPFHIQYSSFKLARPDPKFERFISRTRLLGSEWSTQNGGPSRLLPVYLSSSSTNHSSQCCP